MRYLVTALLALVMLSFSAFSQAPAAEPREQPSTSSEERLDFLKGLMTDIRDTANSLHTFEGDCGLAAQDIEPLVPEVRRMAFYHQMHGPRLGLSDGQRAEFIRFAEGIGGGGVKHNLSRFNTALRAVSNTCMSHPVFRAVALQFVGASRALWESVPPEDRNGQEPSSKPRL